MIAKQVKTLVEVRLAKREIDNAATRDTLYELYHPYTEDIDKATGAALDELWDLRDLYGRALREAKSADIGL